MRVRGGKYVREARGIALMIVMVILMVVAIVVASFGALALENLRATSAKAWERQARFAAYAGIQNSLALLDQDAEFSTPKYTAQLGDSGTLRYSIEIHNNVLSEDGSAILAPDNTWVPPGAAWVRSHGYLGEVGSYQNSALIALVSRARPKFEHAIFAEESIQLTGDSLVNSYDSEVGYDSSASRPDGVHRQEAHLGTNSNSGGAISIGGTSWVDGNAYTGLGSQSNVSLNSIGGTLTGDLLKLPEAVDMFSFHSSLQSEQSLMGSSKGSLTIPNLKLNIGTNGAYVFPWEVDPLDGYLPQRTAFESLTIRANNPTWTWNPPDGPPSNLATNLFSGEYFINGDLTVRHNDSFLGGETLVVNVHANDEFPVVLYVKGDIDLHNVKINTNGGDGSDPKPRRLQIYSVTPDATFTLSGGSELHALVAGRGLKLEVSEHSRLFGGVIAHEATVHDSQVHYDTAVSGLAMNGRTAWDILALKEASAGEASQQAGDLPPPTLPPESLEQLAQNPETGPRSGGDFPAAPGGGSAVIPREVMEPDFDPPICTCGLDLGHPGDCLDPGGTTGTTTTGGTGTGDTTGTTTTGGTGTSDTTGTTTTGGTGTGDTTGTTTAGDTGTGDTTGTTTTAGGTGTGDTTGTSTTGGTGTGTGTGDGYVIAN